MEKEGKKKTVFVGMSGGVDSSVAALLLQRKGLEVIGVFLRCFNVDGCAERDAEDARRVAGKLGIPFYVFDFEEEYKKKVVEYMVEGYRMGSTPNPDIACNREIKFGLFLKKALALGADAIATGHYVKLVANNSNYQLYTARDANKDQSYFLWTLSQDDLRRTMFPIGSLLKSEVREIARKASLPTADKKDSQGICFLGKVTLSEFLRGYIPDNPGEVLSTEGKELGKHSGIHRVTIGQRHIGAPLRTNSKKKDPKPYYVVRKEAETNTVIVAEGRNNPALWRKKVLLQSAHFISEKSPQKEIQCLARVRYRQPLEEATLRKQESGWELDFKNPIPFVAPGQSAVFYIKDSSSSSARSGRNSGKLRMLGGAVISDKT